MQYLNIANVSEVKKIKYINIRKLIKKLKI